MRIFLTVKEECAPPQKGFAALFSIVLFFLFLPSTNGKEAIFLLFIDTIRKGCGSPRFHVIPTSKIHGIQIFHCSGCFGNIQIKVIAGIQPEAAGEVLPARVKSMKAEFTTIMIAF